MISNHKCVMKDACVWYICSIYSSSWEIMGINKIMYTFGVCYMKKVILLYDSLWSMKLVKDTAICDWASENRAYLHIKFV